MSHHYSGPDLALPREDARLDFTHLCASPSQEIPASRPW
jgi:hypothetical protein